MVDRKKRSVASVALLTGVLLPLLALKTKSQWPVLPPLDRVILVCLWIAAAIVTAAIATTFWRYWRIRRTTGR